SGILSTQYSLDGKLSTAPSEYSGAMTLKDGVYDLQAQTRDRASNQTTITPMNFMVDTQIPNAPKVTQKIGSADYDGNYTKEPVTIDAVTDDDPDPISGYKNITYQVYKDNGLLHADVNEGWKVYDPSTKVMIGGNGLYQEDGIYSVRFKVTTQAGHSSKESEATIKYKNTAPDLNVIVNGTAKGRLVEEAWTNKPVSFEVKTTTGTSLHMKKGSAADYTELQSKDGKPIIAHQEKVTEEGITNYSFMSKNEAGIESVTSSYRVAYDTKAPNKPAIKVGTENVEKDKWYGSAAINMNIEDDKTGEEEGKTSPRTLHFRRYAIGTAAGEFKEYSSTDSEVIEMLTVNTDGVYIFEAYAVDAAGNTSATTTETIRFSSALPQVSIAVDKPKVI
ncbi:MAG: Ig-like domain repeat protein, partial [Eubacterium sp.]